MSTSTKPFLRWAGSKRQLVSLLSGYWSDNHEHYIEPFAGSACLFFSLQPKRAILGDINADLIATYDQVKRNLPHLLSALDELKKGRDEYYELRGIDPNTLDPTRRAARFIYLNRFCFNGLYRTNRKGEFNVPYGGEKASKIPSKEMLTACSRSLQMASLIAGDFEVVLEHARPGDFVYLDPPYSVKARRVFNEYDASTFTIDDLRRIRIWLDRLTESGIDFLVSYADCEEAELLMRGYDVETTSVKRNIAGFASKRRKANELISNRSALAA